MDPGRIEAKMTVVPEEGLRCLVVLVAGHDEPVEGPAVAPSGGEDFPGEDLKQGPALHRGHRKGALGAVIAEAGPLASRDGEGRDPARAQGRLAGCNRLGPLGRIAAIGNQPLVGSRTEPSQVNRLGGPANDQRPDKALDFREVDFRRLGKEPGFPFRGQAVKKAKDLALPGPLKCVDQVSGVARHELLRGA